MNVQHIEGHNNSKMITLGSEIVGDTLAKNVVKGFVNGHYDGGRQIHAQICSIKCANRRRIKKLL